MLYKKITIPLNLPRSYGENDGTYNSNINLIHDIINCNKKNEKSIYTHGCHSGFSKRKRD